MLDASPTKTKLRDVVATRLKSYIRDAKLKPGDRLPTESELAARFGVSRLSLREATKSLEFVGILESRPGRGMSVGAVRMDRIAECLGFHSAFDGVDPGELIDTRVVIELGALAPAAARMRDDPAIHERLAEINGRLRAAGSFEARLELDIAFHRGLIAASGLSPLLAFGDVLSVFFRRFRASVARGEWTRGADSHRHIIDCLKSGDVESAGNELRRHIESHRGRLEALP